VARPGPRRATQDDAGTVASIVALAFASDPLWSHALARADGATGHQARFWKLWVDGALRYPWVWLAEGGEATSTWIPPGGSELSAQQEDELSELADECLGSAARDDFHELMARLDAAHPHNQPHYYLSLLATHPDHRGKGVGMALLEQNLELIDTERVPAYLESSNPDNDRRYSALGFEVVGQVCYPGGGPVVTTMWRSAH
jgi:GNAT superfamily N-acetyltransferase